jgi:GTPase SAR1 family protein
MYYRRSVAAVVGYDITCRDSLAVAKSWLQELAEKSPDTHIALVGNKADLADRRSVSERSADSRTSATSSDSPTLPGLAASQARNSLDGLAARTAEKTRRVESGRLKAIIRTGQVGNSTANQVSLDG